ncbi:MULTISPECIES: FliM/FliN family flagellar motor switch protein [Pseudomonas]|uniref:Flagellar motor switch protein FliN-like C-terminal domain-containing protein n=1 Tax=Pseudomonas quercus TaxID=2722792 RepID=A0ABX0YAW5_9PSED|nr:MULTISPECIES: FliM/FliN family flagellar motor switch protein [Pseudomonas]MBF7141009.1 FliM/FliN family flagellar motor switch protein [Pseudomonas sp. LY10J]NJO99543.1 hypothetical protein [Pseudomonas quercus]
MSLVLRCVPAEVYQHQQWVALWQGAGYAACLGTPPAGSPYLNVSGTGEEGTWRGLLAVDRWIEQTWPQLATLLPSEHHPAAVAALLGELPAPLGVLPPGLVGQLNAPCQRLASPAIPQRPMACVNVPGGPLWFTSLPARIPAPPAGAPPAWLRQLPLKVRVSLGRSGIALRHLNRLGVGGVALIRHWGPCVYVADHKVGTLDLCKEPVMTELTASMPEPDWERPLLEQGTLNVEFVLHRTRLSMAEMARVDPGRIVTLPDNALTRVELVVEGRTLGYGELVRVGEALGVEVHTLTGTPHE